MDPGHEILRLPTFLLVKYLLDSKEFDGGFDILGADSFANYEAVLRETYYINTKAGSNFTSRTFSVKCTSMNGKFVSNTFDIKVDLMNSQAQSAVLYADPQYAHIQEQGLLVAGNAAAGVQSAVGTDDEDDETPRDGGLEWDNSSY
ncbi:hypothetical protein EB796_009444 [Bugula neritina]|uniref:Calsyntenin C-terminal domain-containing protein n=1 Tax=Bugula neritina TaxID=10212 RepID=A0A7J7K242_BUGNE|nr:hypothetical protein EB796_009444 [Bugula neritina]